MSGQATRPVRVRFAPSPTGRLHLGNARTALFNWLLARSTGGTFILRVEDTDVERNLPGAEEGILEDLGWLGLDWDEGPDKGGPFGPYRQSDRESSHDKAIGIMLDGGRAYRCFCPAELLERDREEQKGRGEVARYAGRCRGLDAADAARRASAGESHVIRLKVPETGVSFRDLIRGEVTFPGEQLGDQVLIRSDGRPAYNFAVVADDLAMEVSHVLRGEDHLPNTPIQILIYEALGEEPPVFAHLSMILGPDGKRLSKRERSGSVANLREDGYLPEAVVNYLALLGWSHPDGEEVLDRETLIRTFSPDRISGSAAAFDTAKLRFLNTRHLRAMEPGPLLSAAGPFMTESGWRRPDEGSAALDWWARALSAVSGQMETLHDGWVALGILTLGGREAFIPPEDDAAGEIDLMESLVRHLEGRDLAEEGAFRDWAKAAGKETGRKGRGLFHPLRVALTLREWGPELGRLIPLIEEGSRLGLEPAVPSCRQRLEARRQALISRRSSAS